MATVLAITGLGVAIVFFVQGVPICAIVFAVLFIPIPIAIGQAAAWLTGCLTKHA
jgi:hypothetical protein